MDKQYVLKYQKMWDKYHKDYAGLALFIAERDAKFNLKIIELYEC